MSSTTIRSPRPMETAAAYATLGLTVIPECAPTCGCNNPGKRPWDPGDHQHMTRWSQRDVPTRATLESWADADAQRVAAGQAPLNLGCLAGPRALGDDALIGADADGPRGIAEVAAHLGVEASPLAAALTAYRASGRFPLTLGTAAYRTQSGGLRVLWRTSSDAPLRTVGKDANHNGLRLMWRGQQMVLPPSVGPDGTYSWLPGHSPGQVAIAPAPWSVLAAMQAEQTAVPAEPRRDHSPSAVRWPTVPACDGDLGPDSDGRLVPAAQLPYDQALLRDGVAQGARSEAVFALACAMLQAGWPPQAVVATLARQPWIQRMRPNIIGWLTGDVARARAFLPGRGQRTDDARPRDHGDPASERMGTTGQALLGAPTPGASDEDGADQRAPRDPVPDDAEGPDRYAREGLVDRAPHCWQCQAPLSAATHVLILDDWGEPLTAEQARDLWEVLDDRHGRGATIVTSQVPVGQWHGLIPDATTVDAILDRLVHQAYRVALQGESLRKRLPPGDSTRHTDD